MITIRPMAPHEFPAYRALFIEEYAQDLASTRHIHIDNARDDARKSIDTALPAGPDTAGYRLACIFADDSDEIIGYLWIGLNGNTAWIADFCLLPLWRGKGYGRQVLMQLQQTLSAMDIHEIGLRVASNNPGAKALYEKCGFAVTGYNMSMRLR